MTTPTNPKQSVPDHTVLEQTVPEPEPVPELEPEPVAPEQPVPELTQSTIIQPVQIVKVTHYNSASDMDLDSEDDQDDHASDMIIDNDSDQPSTSQPLTTNGQSTTNLAIVPIAPPKPSKQPSPPTIFLDSQILQGVWQEITSEVLKLIEGRSDLGHKISY
jgi:hypothetical protein